MISLNIYKIGIGRFIAIRENSIIYNYYYNRLDYFVSVAYI